MRRMKNAKILAIFCMGLMLGVYSASLIGAQTEGVDSFPAGCPVFVLVDKEVTTVDGGVIFQFSFKNVGEAVKQRFDGWIPMEKFWYTVPLYECGTRCGEISEAEVQYDFNGDGETVDVFYLEKKDNMYAWIRWDGEEVLAKSIWNIGDRVYYDDSGTPVMNGHTHVFDIQHETPFSLDSKNHWLWRMDKDDVTGIWVDARLESDYPSPSFEFYLASKGESVYSEPTALVEQALLDGKPVEPGYTGYETEYKGGYYDWTWAANAVYIYPTGPWAKGQVKTFSVLVRGAPGDYVGGALMNWSPNSETRYRYIAEQAVDHRFTLDGKVESITVFYTLKGEKQTCFLTLPKLEYVKWLAKNHPDWPEYSANSLRAYICYLQPTLCKKDPSVLWWEEGVSGS